jgi:glutamyl-tRNA reductase
MTGTAAVPIVALVTHARHVPATDRERFAAALHREVDGRRLTLETCHRVEAYVRTAEAADRLTGLLPAGGRALEGEAAVRHAMAVAVGRDSVVVGEDQILHQVRRSVDAGRAAGALDPALERLFSLALQAGRRARSWRQGPAPSLADVALASIEEQIGPVHGRDILVVGAGRMGRLAAQIAAHAGASVAVANRSTDGAAALAASVGARTEAFDPGTRIAPFAGVIVALGGPWPIAPGTVDALGSATVVVDLSVPSAVPTGLAEALGSRLVTADELAHRELGPGGPEFDRLARRLDALVDESTAAFVAWLKGRDGRMAAAALVRRADREREAELAALWRRLPDLEPEEREAIEGMTRHLADRLLRAPLERLGRDQDGRDGSAVRDIFAL